MDMLFAAAAVFLAIHFLVSGTRARDAIVGVIGEGPYMGLFSLASLGAIFWLVLSYNHAQASADNPLLYDFGVGVKHLAMPVVLLAFLIGVPGLLTANPTSVRQEGVATRPDAVKGIVAVTRHPFLWGVVIWSAMHLALNGDEASVVLFGTFFVLALSRARFPSMPSGSARWVRRGRGLRRAPPIFRSPPWLRAVPN